MGKSDFRKLRIIEDSIKRGEEVCLIRVLDRESNQWRRVVSVSEKNKSHEIPSVLLDKIECETGLAHRLGDARDISNNDRWVQIAVEILRPKLKLLVFGGGHVGQAVALMGAILGYDVTVADDRPEFVARQRLPDPGIRLLVGNYSQLIEEIKIEPNSAIVIVTRGHQFDEVCLRGTIKSNAGYLGMIGSKRRVVSVINRLKNDGYSDVDFSKLHAPIGLSIGAKSPQEIAIAIHAEIINHFNNRE